MDIINDAVLFGQQMSAHSTIQFRIKERVYVPFVFFHFVSSLPRILVLRKRYTEDRLHI